MRDVTLTIRIVSNLVQSQTRGKLAEGFYMLCVLVVFSINYVHMWGFSINYIHMWVFSINHVHMSVFSIR